MPLYQVALSLFFVLNALGNIPLFLGLLSRYDARRQRRIILRELIIALFILLFFNFLGDDFLRLIGISQPIIGIAGGTLLFIIALGMIFPKISPPKTILHEPMIVPLAMPVIAGPGTIASVMVFSEKIQDPMFMTWAILLAWLPTALILFAAAGIRHSLGEKGLVACERLGGMLICLISVKIFTCGVFDLIKTHFPPCG
jgi:multiple antibiotic resistance protein